MSRREGLGAIAVLSLSLVPAGCALKKAAPPPPPPPPAVEAKPPDEVKAQPPRRDLEFEKVEETVKAVEQPPPPPPPPPPPDRRPAAAAAAREPRTPRLVVLAHGPLAGKQGGSAVEQAMEKLEEGAYFFETPNGLQENVPGRARLMVDADPLVVKSEAERKEALATPGYLPGTLTKVAETMRAMLTAGPGLKIQSLHPVTAEQDVLSSRVSEWLWEVRPAEVAPQTLVLDLQALLRIDGKTRFVSVGPPQVRTVEVAPATAATVEHSVSPPAARSNAPPGASVNRGRSWILYAAAALVLVLLGAGVWVARARMRPPSAAAVVSSVPTLKSRVLIIHGMDEREQAENFCSGLHLERCEFVLGQAGIAHGSPEWQKRFQDVIRSADAALVLLTPAVLGEKWVNWQVEETIKERSRRLIPIYPVVLDERVNRAADTLNRLADLPWLHGVRAVDVEEVKATLGGLEPTSVRRLMCFVSYSRKDAAAFAARLIKSLEGLGIDCYQDVSDIQPGEDWGDALARAIERATHVLVVVSRASLESPNVKDEIGYAREKNKVIVPLLIEDLPLPLNLNRFQAVRFVEDYEAGLAKLAAGLTREASRSASATG